MVVKDKSDNEIRPLTGWDVIVDLAQMWRDERNDRRQFAFDLAERTGELVEKSVRSVMPLALLLMGAPVEKRDASTRPSGTEVRILDGLANAPSSAIRNSADVFEREGELDLADALRLLLVDRMVDAP